MAKYKIAVDAGHGYNTPGKRTPDGEREWSFNNKVVLALIARLKEYGCFDVIRTDDPTGKTDVPLSSRVNKAIAFGADVFVSAHQNANAGRWGSHGGTETYYYGPSANGKRLAICVQPRLVSALGLRNRGVKSSEVLAVLKGFRKAKTVAILTEGAFMDSTTDIMTLRDEAKLWAQGVAIADGIAEYLGVKLPEVLGVSDTKPKPKEDDAMKLNETGREALRQVIKKAVVEGTFDKTFHTDAKIAKYSDSDLISYGFTYFVRKIK